MNKLINGVNLQQAANAIYDVDRRDDLTRLKSGDVIWCKTDYLHTLFEQIKHRDEQFVLITHCSDYSIIEPTWLSKPKCIKKWFAQNTDYYHSDLIPLPIGVENHIGPNRGSNTDFSLLDKESFDVLQKNKIISHVFCNYRPTHPSRERATKAFIENNLGHFYNALNYIDFCNTVKKYLFVASPRGNGIDCHRTWEALYYGCIPIVEKHFMYDSYLHLPIIQVSNWNNITPELLAPYIEKYRNKQYFLDISELKLEYWINKIKTAL
jgi:hypothetical protein